MDRRHCSPLTVACIIGLISLIAAVSILSSVPPVSRDALVHHLAIPKLYLQHGGIYEIPSLPFSYYPMNLDFLYIIPLYFKNDILPKFIHFSFALMTAGMIFGYLRRRIDLAHGLLGALFFLSTPIVVKLSITAYVDLGLAFFSTASILMILKWAESGFKLRYLSGAAVACGLGMGTKYNGLLVCFLHSLIVVLVFVRSNLDATARRYGPGYGAFFILIALLCFSPWMLRNAIWTGNPVFPLLQGVFGGGADSGEPAVSLLTYRRVVYGESWWEIAMLPVRVFFQGEDGNGRFFDGRLNPFLLVLPICAFFLKQKETAAVVREKNVLLLFSITYFTFTLLSIVMRVRYLVPLIPSVVILGIFGVRNLTVMSYLQAHRHQKMLSLGLYSVLLAGMFLPNALYIREQFRWVNPFDYLSGAVSREAYITHYRPEYPAMAYINSHLPADARILFLFLGKRGYYCGRDYVIDDREGIDRFSGVVQRSVGPSEIRARLKREGITHLLVCEPLIKKWTDETLEAGEKQRLRMFLDQETRALFAENGYAVLELAPD